MTYQDKLADIRFTIKDQANSSLVNNVWYNENTQDLYLELSGVVYRYSSVPVQVYRDVTEAHSPGSYYGDYIRSQYKPATRLGVLQNLTQQVVVVVPTSYVTNNVTFGQNKAATVSFTPTPQLALTKDVEPDENLRYDLVFTLPGDNVEKVHTVQALNVDDALHQLFDFANKLNADVTPVRATVHFE